MSMKFTAKTEAEAFQRCGGLCEECGGLLKPGQFQFDHKQPQGLAGDGSLANCLVLCVACHLRKTLIIDMPRMRAADRQKKAHALKPSAGPSALSRRGFVSASEQKE